MELLSYNSGRGYNPVGPDLAVAVQGFLQKIGVKVNVQKVEFGAYLSQIRSAKYGGMFLRGMDG